MNNSKPDAYKIIFGAVALIMSRSGRLVKALLIPFSLYYVIEIAPWLGVSADAGNILLIPKLLLYTFIAVITHRILLLGSKSVPVWGVSGWTMRESYFLIHMVALIILVMAALAATLVSMPVGLALTLYVCVYLFARLSLVFPASAIGHGVTFATSWKLTRKHQLTMVFLMIFGPLIYGIPVYIVSSLPYGDILAVTLDVIGTVFLVGMLSVAYSEIYQYEYADDKSLNPGRA